MTNFVKIQSGNFEALIRPENLAKIEAKLAKVKPDYKPPMAKDLVRTYPTYEPGMSTLEYVRSYERLNRLSMPSVQNIEGYTGLYSAENCNPLPAAQYDPLVPLCVEDANPDYIAGVDDAPVKPKRARKAAKVMPDKSAVMWLLMDHGLTMYQANPLADKLLALFEGTNEQNRRISLVAVPVVR